MPGWAIALIAVAVAVPVLAVVSIVAITFLGSSSEERFSEVGSAVGGPSASTPATGPTSVPVATAPPGLDGAVDAFSIVPGDCLDDLGEGEVLDVPLVACTQAHDFEVYSLFDVSGVDYDVDRVDSEALLGCQGDFGGFAGTPYEISSLEFTWLSPTPGSWDQGDREIVCMIYDPAGTLTGSVQGSGR